VLNWGLLIGIEILELFMNYAKPKLDIVVL